MGSGGCLCCGATGLKAWGIVSALLAIACFSVAIFVPRAIDRALDDGIHRSVVVDAQAQRDQSDAYKLYVNPDEPDATPLYYRVYLFNLTNAADVLAAAATPAFTERGPYTYLKRVYKHDVEFETNVYAQALVKYRTQTQYTFLPDMSAGAETDLITNCNLVFAATKGPLQGQLWRVFGPAGPADAARFFMTKTVSEWLFGYADPVLAAMAAQFPGYVSPRSNGILGPNEQSYRPGNPLTTQYVGSEPDQALIRTYVTYEGMEQQTTTSFVPPTTVVQSATWRTARANRIGGTDATMFARELQAGQTVQIYTSSLARTVTLGNVDGAQVRLKGIDLLHFTLPSIFLGNADAYPPNSDFFMFGYTGAANLTATGKLDFFITKPHYLDADAELLARVAGLDAPSRDAHDTFLDVEPITGVTMRAAKRLQLSVRLTPVVANVNNATHPVYVTWGAALPHQDKGQYMPVYWAEEAAELSDDSAAKFKKAVYGARTASYAIMIAGEAAACLFVVVAVALLLAASRKAVAAATGTDGGSGGSSSVGGGIGGGSSAAVSDNRVVPINDHLAPSHMPPPATTDAGAGAAVQMTANN